MFDLIPFENRNSNLFRWLDRFDDDFFKTTENSFSPAVLISRIWATDSC